MAAVTPPLSGLTSTAANSSILSSSRACVKTVDATGNDTFPAGLRVLVVDDDPICLLILDRMLRHCQYQVTTCGKATEALAMLRENRNSFDVILSDVYMPDMDGFKLLELVGLEMDLPVIMMSANGETSAVMKGIIHGACDYLLKPVRMEELRNIWQHVVRKKWRSSGQTASHEVDKARQAVDEVEHTSSANEGQDGSWRQSKKRKDLKEEEDEVDLESDDPSSTKKPRVVWSAELHQQFVNAVHQLGIDKAVPKRILELMSAQGLTRENVASHLQKYRLYLKRLNGVVGHQSAAGLSHPFPVAADANFGSVNVSGLAGLNELRNIAGPSSSALVSSLQPGALARMNATNMGMTNLDPSVLLQLAALQGAGNGPLMRPPPSSSGGQPTMNMQGSYQGGSNDLSQLHPSQLGAFAGLLDKGPPGLSVFQPQQQQQQHNHHNHRQQQHHQLAAMARLGELGPIPGIGNNLPIVSLNNSALLLQTLQQQQSGGNLTNSSKGSLPMPTNAGLGGQQALPADMDHWTAAALAASNSSSLRLLSVPPLVNSAAALAPVGRTTDIDNRGTYVPNAGISSPSISSGPDELGKCGQIKDIGGPVIATNEEMHQSYPSKFGLPSGMKQEQETFSGQRSQGLWQSPDMTQEQGHFHGNVRSLNYSQSFSGGQGLMLGTGQALIPRFSTGFSDSTLDAPHLNAFQMRYSQADSVRASAEGNSKIKEEGNLWLQEPLSDEVLTLLLKQQQESLGLAESELGADGYATDNMYVK